jgi:anaerobic ribonucleoside-triphosphate reductase
VPGALSRAADDSRTTIRMSPIKTNRQECEVYSRVTGYLRPVKQWNDAKEAEYNNRKTFCLADAEK